MPTAEMVLMKEIARTGSASLTSLNVRTVDAFHRTGSAMKNQIVPTEVMKAKKLLVKKPHRAALAIQAILSKLSLINCKKFRFN